MGNLGNDFRDHLKDYILSWGEPLEVLTEVNVGWRFVGTPRRLDLVIRNTENNKTMAVECKVQHTSGTAYEKLSYALEDCIASPIPTILAFAGDEIRMDMKSKLIMSGYGVELIHKPEEEELSKIIQDPHNIFRQRCYIELQLNWFPFATGLNIKDQLEKIDG